MFHRFSDETSFFVATLNQRPVGLETPFSIQLADRSPVLRGTCVVLAAWPTAENPFKRPGVRLGIKRLTPESEPVFARLQQARLANRDREDTDTATLEPMSETPVAIPLPNITTGPIATIPPRVPSARSTGSMPITSRSTTGPMPATARTSTGTNRRLGSVMTPAMIPPRTPPEASVLEVILPIVADSPSEAMALPIEVEPPIELRTPHSEFILPANPLMNLTDESLQGFIDCTLYEDTANFPFENEMQVLPAIPLLAGDEHVLIARTGNTIPPPIGGPMRRTGSTIPPVLRLEQNVLREEPSQVSAINSIPGMVPVVRTRSGNTVPPVIRLEASGLLRVDLPTGQSEPLRVETQSGHSGQLRLESSGLLRVEGEAGHSGVLRVDGHSGMLRIEPMAEQMPQMPYPVSAMHAQPFTPPRFFSDEMVRTPVPAGEAFVPPRARRSTSRMSFVSQRTMLIGGSAAAASLALILVVATRSSASDETPPPPPKQTVQATRPSEPTPAIPSESPAPKPTVAKTRPEPTKSETKPVVAEPPEDPPSDGPVVVGEGPCKLDVKTTPAGTMVSLDGRTLGPSPLTIAGPCERHRIDLVHPRYKSEQRFVVMTSDKPNNLEVNLIRPTHSMKILTSPPGAEVFIAGRRAGTSPTIVRINGFSGIKVRIERVGFGTVSTRVYSKVADDKLFIGLTPNRRPK
jgi:hypothetical protein